MLALVNGWGLALIFYYIKTWQTGLFEVWMSILIVFIVVGCGNATLYLWAITHELRSEISDENHDKELDRRVAEAERRLGLARGSQVWSGGLASLTGGLLLSYIDQNSKGETHLPYWVVGVAVAFTLTLFGICYIYWRIAKGVGVKVDELRKDQMVKLVDSRISVAVEAAVSVAIEAAVSSISASVDASIESLIHDGVDVRCHSVRDGWRRWLGWRAR